MIKYIRCRQEVVRSSRWFQLERFTTDSSAFISVAEWPFEIALFDECGRCICTSPKRVFADSEAVSTLLSFRQLEPTYSLTKDGPPGSHSMSSEGTEANKEEVAFKLTAAQEAWREKAALEWMGSEHMDMHGGRAVLPDEFLQNVVSSAAQGKLTSVDALEQETRWRQSLKYGAEVLDIVHLYFPLKVASIPFAANSEGPSIEDSTMSTSAGVS